MYCYPFERVASSKKECKSIECRFFFDRSICKKGHVSKRTKTGACAECEKERSRCYKLRNPDAAKRHNKTGWQKKKKRFHEDSEYRDQSRHQAKMKIRRYRSTPGLSDEMRIKNSAQKKSEYHRRIKTDEEFKAMKLYRSLIKRCVERVKGYKKAGTTIEELGYSAQDLKLHIESMFEEGMSWGNHGDWHIDHIRPICTFPKNSTAKDVNALKNLRPLWARDNITRPRAWDE